MPDSLQDIINWAMPVLLITGVAVMAARAIGEEHHSISWEAKKPLIEKYGTWAVNQAEAFCPHNDVACVEREARRLIDTYKQRRAT